MEPCGIPYDVLTILLCSVVLNIIFAGVIMSYMNKVAEVTSDLDKIKKIINKGKK